jgi:cytolysin (calcineurin-like family phosphatase)
MKPAHTLPQVALLMGGLAAQNVGIGTNAPTDRAYVAANLHLDNAFMPGNQAGAVSKTLLSQGAAATSIMSTKWRHGYHPHEHGLRQHSHAWVPTPSTPPPSRITKAH